MKKLYFFALLAISLGINAQKKVDLDRFRFSVQYRSLPKMQIDSTYRTYNVEVEGTRLMQSFLNEMSPENSVLLEGWRKLPQDGHLDIKVKLGDLVPESVSVKERIETSKNRAGQVSTKTYYRQEVVYSFEALATITDYKGAHIMDQELAGRGNKQVYRSPEFASRILAEGYFALNSLTVTKELYQGCVTRAMHYLSERITDNFGFNAVTSNDFMWIVDSRKHPEYTAHRQAFQQISEVLFNMNANTSIDGAREQLKPVIDYFEKIKRIYSSTSKHDRKMKYASYFNLAVLYYYLDDPQAMMKEAKGLELNDYDAKDARGFVQTATWLKNLFEQNNIYTRHFTINPAAFKGPYEKAEVTAK
ncbi:MAG: hypothetical protein JNJ86_04510 [Chitinophagaceae bacterium]|nr:hypothetical protein [Chitinophagaceae bacterium]